MANTTEPARKNTWTFRSRFRSGAYGWRGSPLACQRIREAVTSQWADRFLPLVRQVWSHPNSGFVVSGSLCLSSLLAAGRHQELWQLLELDRHPFWHYRQFGVQALVKEGRIDEALAYAEASRGLNQPQSEIDAVCEQILLDAGRSDEAYTRYALTANVASTGVATFRAIARKYPQREPRQILSDLARAGGEPGRWFAAAKDAGLLDLALHFAQKGRTDPRTLSRAARDFITRDEAAVTALHGEEQARAEIAALAAHPQAQVRAFQEVLRRQAAGAAPATQSPVT